MGPFDNIQSDEMIPAQYDMSPEEWAEFQEEYNEYLDDEPYVYPEDDSYDDRY